MNRDETIKKIIDHKDEIDTLIHRKYHELAKKNKLSLEQFHLLIELDELMLDIKDEYQAPTIGEIAKNINHTQNTVSERITRLETKGLVKRVKDLNDRRISRVFLTEEGRNFIELIEKEASSKFLFHSLSNMEETDLNSLESCLNILIKQMK